MKKPYGTRFHNTHRDGEDAEAICVEFTSTGGCSAHYGSMNYPGHPAEAPEIEIWEAWSADAKGRPVTITLTEAEDTRICEECAQLPDDEPDYDFYD